MADITTLYNLLQATYTDITVFNIEWLLSIPLVIGTSFIITRNPKSIGLLLLPLTIIYHIVGVTPNYVWYIITTMLFVFTIFTTQNITNLLTTNIRKGGQETYQDTVFFKDRYRKKKLTELWEEQALKRDKKTLNELYEGGIMNPKEMWEAIQRGKGRR